jgi:peptidoglycan/LPS O-acetylase OafA/YrhL
VSAHPAEAARAPGLDSLRAGAIVLVFMHHYMVFVSHTATFGWASELGWVGVDLFFVLSGYLITDQLLAGLVAGQRLSLAAFYIRRALRTWPVFWVVLAAYFLWPAALGGRTPPPLWRFLSFTQNLGLQPGTAFSHAWSLCVEEQFYAVLPLVLLAGQRLGAGRRAGWALLAGLIALGIASRAWLWTQYGLEAGHQVAGYHPHIYYATLCRFDEFLPGVAVAMIKHLHPLWWQWAMRQGPRLLVVALAACGLWAAALLRWYYVDGYGYTLPMTALGYSVNAGVFALLLLAALSPGSPLARWRIPGAAALAKGSYAIYLSHKAIAFALQQLLGSARWHPAAQLRLVTAACLAGGWLLYRTVEQPFMRWRSRLAPGNFPAARAPGGATRPHVQG